MNRLLVITSSPRGAASQTNLLADAVVDAYEAAAQAGNGHARAEIDRWDLWTDTLRPFGPDAVDAKMTIMRGDRPSGRALEAWQHITAVFERFDAADIYVFGVPMWNTGIPWVLKHWIDTVTQPGLLFRFDPATGYQGLLRNKRAVVAYSSSVYRPGVDAAFGCDHHSTYFADWLAFAGIDDVRTVRMQPSHPSSDRYEERAAAAGSAARSIGAQLARRSASQHIHAMPRLTGTER